MFISLFHFLIYYNLAIYMNKAVRSVECYLLPSCVFVNGATFEEKMNFFSLLFWSDFNRIMWTLTSHKLSFPWPHWWGKENLWELLKKIIYQSFKNVDLASFWRGNMLFYWYLSVSYYCACRPGLRRRTPQIPIYFFSL